MLVATKLAALTEFDRYVLAVDCSGRANALASVPSLDRQPIDGDVAAAVMVAGLSKISVGWPVPSSIWR